MATQQSKTPGDIFQEKFGKICPLIGKRENFNTVTGNFFEKKLLAKKKLDQIDSQPNLNDEERGREVAKSLLEKINEDEDQAAQCLLKICDVFQSKDVDNEPLRKIGASMREKLSTKANQTSGHQGKKIDKDNGHDETDSGSQDGATQPPKQDSEKKKSDEPQATQNSKQKDKESGDEETDGPAEGGYHLPKYCKAKQLKKWGALTVSAIIIVLAGVTINHLIEGKKDAATDASPSLTGQPHHGTPDGVRQLDAEDVDKILIVLDKVFFGAAKWNDLGLQLCLYQPKLNVIADGGDAYRHLRKTIEAWLNSEDNARSRTWQTLIDAVRGTGNRAAAEKMPQKLKELYNITV
ncbi:PREDICTED: uncharacterized protein LOC109582579 [Amphimedon queenslandica]|uniref:Death domain-containing protein n=1 Tax=Amphimedon queenslandica TaxID=400682 RepID=A0A1X7UPZ1_AMPQE|nr:PREDICTED: uncharacterized protein LOC109582579 [Amphimedon queenslandica]|eukprot:XP_019852899.1 PREDICTED: uncharacterized protein LOC109582579 [Amphimedon queenslandica]